MELETGPGMEDAAGDDDDAEDAGAALAAIVADRVHGATRPLGCCCDRGERAQVSAGLPPAMMIFRPAPPPPMEDDDGECMPDRLTARGPSSLPAALLLLLLLLLLLEALALPRQLGEVQPPPPMIGEVGKPPSEMTSDDGENE